MINKFLLTLIPDIIQNKAKRGPLIAVLNINSVCNLRCEFCWIHSILKTNRPKPLNVPFTNIKKILDELKLMGTTQISLSADGEPWLHPEIVKIINYTKKNNFFLRITTNLTFNNKKILLAFTQADMLDINLSAPDKKTYNIIHNPNNKMLFDSVIKNLVIYSKLYNERKKPLLELNYIITKNNYQYIRQMLNLIDELKIPNIRFRILDTTEDTRSLFLRQEEIIRLKNDIKSILDNVYKGNHNLKEIDTYLGTKGQINFDLKRCFIGWIMVSIEYNGNLGLCCQHGNLIIGNWKKQSIKESWYSERANKLRQKAKNEFDIAKPFWKNCLFCCSEKKNKEIEYLLMKFNK